MLQYFLSIVSISMMFFPVYYLGYWNGATPAAPLHKDIFFALSGGIMFGIGLALNDELEKSE